ncbi:uncharacterized protein LOC111022644 [Momordica charantia]|uniref:Uncharacterized protein LOC111022644 n=1 Tax=Momordica charantia TaxID=3673 RepID=A0A6J1DPJ8_MOMCH|nr:uncharacterized protein LOC111022644 [Momordica charantia]
MDSSKPSRRPCFLQEDDGLASFADMDPAVSAHRFFSRPRSFRRLPSAAAATPEDPHPHFLDSCFLCRKPLADNADIFMYRGDTPFCSEECREEQIEIDEAKEKKWRRSSSAAMKALRKKDQRRSTSPNKSSPPNDYPLRAGTVAAA